MDIAPSYNGLGGKIRRCVTWQYDKAPNIIGVIGIIDAFYRASTETLFNIFMSQIYDLANASAFGLSVWGGLLGFPRPTWNNNSTPTPISDDYYKRLLLARLSLISSNYSIPSICRALKIAYGNRIVVLDSGAGRITYRPKRFSTISNEESWLAQNNTYTAFWSPCGVRALYSTTEY